MSTIEQRAIALGMSIMSQDANVPRLMRAIVPRAAAPGMAPQAAARDHVAALAPLWGVQASAAPLVETGTQQLRNGATVVMFEQQVNGVLVNQGDLRVMMHADKSLAAVSGTLVSDAVKPSFVSSARAAVDRALDQLHGTARTPLVLTEAGEADGWTTVTVSDDPVLGATEARARKELAKVDGQLVEAWHVELIGNTRARAARDPGATELAGRSYLIADATGNKVSEADLVAHDAFVYRVYSDTTGNRRPTDGPLQSFAPHPTGVPDGSRPGLVPSSLVVMDAFNGPFDKWLPDNATTTAGNNAEAFADLDASTRFSTGDIRPEVRAGRVLNYNYNHAAGPLDTPDQSKAATVNAFFVVNWMHDWWYDSGFTEATRNGQLDNYGRGGVANDRVLIQAQAGANTGLRNNADMLTPADGGQPRMRMFLWSAAISVSFTSPVGPQRTNRFLNGPHAFDVTGDLVLGTDITAPTDDGCQRLTNVTGKIALINFSNLCDPATAINNAKTAGAIGFLLIDDGFDLPGFFGGSATANLPALTTDLAGGAALRAALAAGPVSITLHSEVLGVERDGDFDNGIVAHEWGHYMHHRLANCVSGPCNGMSEGWGDFNALLLMLREDENRDGTYAMGPYALDDGTFDSAYFGIRRFPYSTDRTKNALSFRHISNANPLPTETPGELNGAANAEVHNTGEIWAQMLWDVLNVLADEHGVTIARRRMTDYAVGGLLLTPPNASFTEARDAILAAASALDTDDMTLMAAAFAGRGIGSCAVSPPISSTTNAGVVESGTLAAVLTAGGATLIDDGISCDRDGILDPGESGRLRVTVANTGLFAADDVNVTATTTAPGVRIGAPVQVAAVGPHTSLELSIPVTLLPTAPRNTPITLTLHVAGLNLCARTGIDVSLTVPTGIDELANASTIDRVQTTITPWTNTGTAGLWNVTADATGNKLWTGRDSTIVTDTQLVSPALLASPTAPFVVKFSHSFSLEAGFDGGVIELSTNGGTTWTDAATQGVTPGYTRTLSAGSPLAGRMAYSGASPGFPARTLVTLDFGTRFAGQSVLLRFRLATDTSVGGTGWNIDDIDVSGITNTPFPALVPETSTCTARQAQLEDSAVISVQEAPATSLDAYDGTTCILRDAE